jgi:hypothetical protein
VRYVDSRRALFLARCAAARWSFVGIEKIEAVQDEEPHRGTDYTVIEPLQFCDQPENEGEHNQKEYAGADSLPHQLTESRNEEREDKCNGSPFLFLLSLSIQRKHGIQI